MRVFEMKVIVASRNYSIFSGKSSITPPVQTTLKFFQNHVLASYYRIPAKMITHLLRGKMIFTSYTGAAEGMENWGC